MSMTNDWFGMQENMQNGNKGFVVFRFFRALAGYIRIRFRQISLFSYAAFVLVTDIFVNIKSWVIRRMFWGRSSLYRTFFHSIVALITILTVLSGISTRLNIVAVAETGGLDISSGIIGRQDVLSQSGTAESISITGEDQYDFPIYRHIVEKGQTLSQIADLYQISMDTIVWANGFSSKNVSLTVGQVLRIPGINGAFVKVKRGDTLDKIAKTNKGNVADILDLNSRVLDAQNPVLSEGMELFIPGGQIPAPPIIVARKYSSPINVGDKGGYYVPSGTFVNPLSSFCPGYTYIRGFSPWHGGVDMAKAGGCWENAAAAGTVIRAGWGSGGVGFHVIIDHGNGLKTRYYHGNGSFAVHVGDHVLAGQKIMYMGCTGNCTGTHLHFEIVINEVRVNPENYVRLR